MSESFDLIIKNGLCFIEGNLKKVDIGVKDSLIREIKEELDYAIQVEREFLTVEHQYPDFRLLMHSYPMYGKRCQFHLN